MSLMKNGFMLHRDKNASTYHQPWETLDDIKFIMPTLRSHRFPSKVMYLGVVVPPVDVMGRFI